MAYISLGSYVWGNGPDTTVIFSYEKERSGADMKYRVKIQVPPLKYTTSYFGFPIYMKTTLNGTLVDTHTVKAASPSQWSSNIVYETDWFTVKNKTSGTTPLSLNVYSGSGNTRNKTYEFDLEVDPAASVLGTISNFTIGNAIDIPITKYNSSFTDTLDISVGGTVVWTGTVTNGYDVTFSSSVLSTIYSKMTKTTATFTFKLTTKSGSTVIGTSTKTATGTIKGSTIGTVAVTDIAGGVPVTINKSTGLTDTLKITVGSTTIKTVNVTSSAFTVTFSSTELANIYAKYPNVETFSLTFTLTTKNGDTTISDSTVTRSGTIPASVKPSISSVTVSEAGNLVPSSWGIYVKNKSKFKFVTSASAGSGASISSITTTFNGIPYSGATVTTGVVNAYGNLVANITVTDTRGRSATTTKTVTVVDYYEPYGGIVAYRCDSAGNKSDTGTYMFVDMYARSAPVNSKNTGDCKIMYKKTTASDSSWSTVAPDDWQNITSIDSHTILSGIEAGSSYNVKLVITDSFTSVTKAHAIIPSVYRTLNFKAGGRALGIGKMAEQDNLIDMGLPAKFSGGIEAVELPVGTDLNDVLTPGFYKCHAGGALSYSNAPTRSGGGILEVSKTAEGVIRQVFTKSRHNNGYLAETSTGVFERYYTNIWGRWSGRGQMYAYNTTGDPDWFKILTLTSTSGYTEISGTVMVKGGASTGSMIGIFAFTYYNNDKPRLRILSGNISVARLRAYKNSDNTLDIYVKTNSVYTPLHITLLSISLNSGLSVDIEPECIGSSLSLSGGTEYTFQNANHCGGFANVLYQDTAGNRGTVTLSDTAANYNYMEIYFMDNNSRGVKSVKIENPNGKRPDISAIEAENTTSTYIRRTRYHISGYTITPDTTNCGYVYFNDANSPNVSHYQWSGTNYIFITKVIGYD